jgi:hypothetical protein
MRRAVAMRSRPWVWPLGIVLAGSLLTSCSAARTGLGTADESCYLALPTAAKAVGGHAHLAGVRRYTLTSLRSLAPRLYRALSSDVSTKQSVCLAAYTGHFTQSTVDKGMGREEGPLAVAVVTSPGNELLGTLILYKIPVRFQHTHPF